MVATQVVMLLRSAHLTSEEMMEVLRRVEEEGELANLLGLVSLPWFRQFLRSQGVSWQFIFMNWEAGVLDCGAIFAGFLAGAGETVVDAIRLIVALVGSPFSEALAQERDQFLTAIEQFFTHPITTASEAAQTSYQSFVDHLWNLRMFEAGRMLGFAATTVLTLPSAIRSVPSLARSVARMSVRAVHTGLGVSRGALMRFARNPSARFQTPDGHVLMTSGDDIVVVGREGQAARVSREAVLREAGENPAASPRSTTEPAPEAVRPTEPEPGLGQRPTEPAPEAVRPTEPAPEAVRPTEPEPGLAQRPTEPAPEAVRPTEPAPEAVRPTEPEPGLGQRPTEPAPEAVRPTEPAPEAVRPTEPEPGLGQRPTEPAPEAVRPAEPAPEAVRPTEPEPGLGQRTTEPAPEAARPTETAPEQPPRVSGGQRVYRTREAAQQIRDEYVSGRTEGGWDAAFSEESLVAHWRGSGGTGEPPFAFIDNSGGLIFDARRVGLAPEDLLVMGTRARMARRPRAARPAEGGWQEAPPAAPPAIQAEILNVGFAREMVECWRHAGTPVLLRGPEQLQRLWQAAGGRGEPPVGWVNQNGGLIVNREVVSAR
jgi:hypothetical protein